MFNGSKIRQYPLSRVADPSLIPSQVETVYSGDARQQVPDAVPGMRWGANETYEKPIIEFPGDITIGSSVSVTLRAGVDLPKNCVGLRFINLIPNVTASVNMGGSRTILSGDAFAFRRCLCRS